MEYRGVFLFIIYPIIRNGFDTNCVKLWTFFCKFYMLSIKFNYAALFSLWKLLQSWFHLAASSFSDPVKCKTRLLFCDCLSLLFSDTSVSVLQCFSSRSFHSHCHDHSHCVHLNVFLVGRFLLPAVISIPDLSDSVTRTLLHILLQMS